MNENISFLTEAIDKYGPITVILSVFLMLFIVIMHNTNKSLKDFQDKTLKNEETYRRSITEQNNKMMEQLLNTKEIISSPHLEKDLFNVFMKLRTSISDNCKNAMDKISADRLAIYLFHNGSHSTHGINFFKTSCICEKVLIGSGIRERSVEHSNIPINLFDDMIGTLATGEAYVIFNDDQLQNTNRRIFISAQKIKYAQAVAIFDNNNNILGFVLAEMSHDYDKAIADEETKTIKALINQIMPVLTYSDYVDINLEKGNR